MVEASESVLDRCLWEGKGMGGGGDWSVSRLTVPFQVGNVLEEGRKGWGWQASLESLDFRTFRLQRLDLKCRRRMPRKSMKARRKKGAHGNGS